MAGIFAAIAYGLVRGAVGRAHGPTDTIAAEQLGYEAMWLGEHHFRDYGVGDPELHRSGDR